MPAFKTESNLLIYKGSNFLKQRLLLSTLSGKPVKIIEIRKSDENPGLKEYEVSLVRLFDKITNGTNIELSQNGLSLLYQPGLLHGGTIQHDCSLERGIGYYLDVLLALGPFCKTPLNAILRGVTNSKDSPSVDHIKASAFSTLLKFLLVDDGLELKIMKRGMMPLGGGEIHFKCPVRKTLKSIQCTNSGMVKRIRGVAYISKISPALANRSVESAKGVMLNFIPDVYINTDQNRGKISGNSPGYGINLIAETTEKICYSVEVVSNVVQNNEEPSVPEELGIKCAQKLLDEIYRGGCVDSAFQWLVALYMALGQNNVSKFLTGPLSQYTIHFLQHLREFFGITFKLENARKSAEGNDEVDNEEDNNFDDDDDASGSNKVMLTCVGINYSNVSKKVT